MAKRANPFVDDFIPQSKVHVGVKQFNNNEDRLKKVYEKTLQLLYKGANKIPPTDILNNNDVNFTKKNEKMKQLFIGKDGALMHTGSMKQILTGPKTCECGASVECQCAYCDAELCAACEHACERCQSLYCAQCMLLGSEGSEVCVSCYG